MFVSFALFDSAEEGKPITRPLFDTFFNPIEDVLKQAAPGLKLNSDEEILAQGFLSKNGEENSDAAIKDVAYERVNNYIGHFSITGSEKNARQYFSIAAIIVFFIFFRIFSLVFMWFSFALTALVVKVLILYNIILVDSFSVKQEKARLK